jgi:hypothetical protein
VLAISGSPPRRACSGVERGACFRCRGGRRLWSLGAPRSGPLDRPSIPRVVAPPPTVLDAFGAAFEPKPLAGGQGRAWKAGDIVLKPLGMAPVALEWQFEVLSTIRPDGFRVAPPRRSTAGELVVEGWTAWTAVAGEHAPRWKDIISVVRFWPRIQTDVYI